MAGQPFIEPGIDAILDQAIDRALHTAVDRAIVEGETPQFGVAVVAGWLHMKIDALTAPHPSTYAVETRRLLEQAVGAALIAEALSGD